MDIAEILRRTECFVVAATAADWAEAGRQVTTDPLFAFPTGRFRSLADLAQALSGRYQTIEKVFESRDAWVRPDGTFGVCLSGTLRGVNLHGVPFEGVRFLDRLIVSSDGLVLEQHVYNDLVHSGVLDTRQSGPGDSQT